MISIVFQGPTNYINNLPNVKNHKYDFVFSTWSEEPKENLEIIKKKGFHLVTTDMPKFTGFNNINCQTISSLNGITASKGDFILKIRSDMLISDFDKFIDSLSDEKMYFLAYHNHAGGYVCDYINFGKREDMLLWYSYLQKDISPTPPEIQLLFNYWSLKKYDFSILSFPQIKNVFSFFLEVINTKNIDIFWFKNNLNLKNYINDKLFVY